jgi:serine/threonine-protein kinase ULK2
MKLDGESDAAAERRRNAVLDAEYNAVTCVALYLLLMAFSQKGIDRLRVHQEGMKMRDPEGRLEVSEGFDDGEFYATHCFSSRVSGFSMDY